MNEADILSLVYSRENGDILRCGSHAIAETDVLSLRPRADDHPLVGRFLSSAEREVFSARQRTQLGSELLALIAAAQLDSETEDRLENLVRFIRRACGANEPTGIVRFRRYAIPSQSLEKQA